MPPLRDFQYYKISLAIRRFPSHATAQRDTQSAVFSRSPSHADVAVPERRRLCDTPKCLALSCGSCSRRIAPLHRARDIVSLPTRKHSGATAYIPCFFFFFSFFSGCVLANDGQQEPVYYESLDHANQVNSRHKVCTGYSTPQEPPFLHQDNVCRCNAMETSKGTLMGALPLKFHSPARLVPVFGVTPVARRWFVR